MKFQQLPMGARFLFEGAPYRKTSPLLASAEDGGSRMIPRWAVVQPLDVTAPPAPARPATLPSQAVVAALTDLQHRLQAMLDALDLPAGRLTEARAELAAAHMAALAQLGLPGQTNDGLGGLYPALCRWSAVHRHHHRP